MEKIINFKEKNVNLVFDEIGISGPIYGPEAIHIYFNREQIGEYSFYHMRLTVSSLIMTSWIFGDDFTDKNFKLVESYSEEFASLIEREAKEYLDTLDREYKLTSLSKAKAIPQDEKLPYDATLLGVAYINEKLIRAYNEWDNEKKILYQFVTCNGGKPEYTRNFQNATQNFTRFWNVLNHGALTQAGQKYMMRHSEKRYARERVY